MFFPSQFIFAGWELSLGNKTPFNKFSKYFFLVTKSLHVMIMTLHFLGLMLKLILPADVHSAELEV